MFLHLIDHLGGPVHTLVRTTDMQVRLARRNLHAQRPAQKTKVAIGGAEQLQLLFGV
jgi:hypothetical protein